VFSRQGEHHRGRRSPARGLDPCIHRIKGQITISVVRHRFGNQRATRLETLEEPGIEHHAVAMSDPEGNEFDIN
jgi:hypothetical protein